jgi:DUF177 domain-containing protein
MPQRADLFDLESLQLPSGGGTRLLVEVPVQPVRLGGQEYRIEPGTVEACVDVSRTLSGFALRLRFEVELSGPCMRCLSDATPVIAVDSREVEQPGEAEELHTPYLEGAELELGRWVRDALLLALPTQLICREDCRGLCPVCGADLNRADEEEHRHETAGDPRWAKLRELEFE